LLKAETVEQMTKNQLSRNAFPMQMGGMPRPGVGFGLGFSVVVNGPADAPVGVYGWGGAASTHFWISPNDELAVVVLSQHMPFSPQLESAVKPLVYDAIVK
jgi:CubicO group peptidase (beta-lactamase class C family)